MNGMAWPPSPSNQGKQHVYGLDGGDLPHIIHGDIRCLLLLRDERPTSAEVVYWHYLSLLLRMFLSHLLCVFNCLATLSGLVHGNLDG